MNLVIVESPTKAKTISRFLNKDFKIESSFGHVRDLPKNKLGVETERNFQPTYIIPPKARPHIKKISNLAKKAQTIYYATDKDREGEAISWHLDQLLTKKYKINSDRFRITFHEITQEAILKALKKPGQINLNLVNAQQARRILDRLLGYKLSPFLWKKVARGLSAGRVQSVALKLIVEREEEIKNFKTQEYWSLEGIFKTNPIPDSPNSPSTFNALLSEIDSKKLTKFAVTNKKQTEDIIQQLQGLNYSIANITEKENKKKPHPPYKTSTLQQDAYHKLGFSSKQTMLLAQQLYEGINLGNRGSSGLITYMRTDSLNLAHKFIVQAQRYLKKTLGGRYSFDKAPTFKNKTKSSQEAHEAIRPTDLLLEPKLIKQYLNPQQYKLYKLIWQRALASLMPPAVINLKIIKIRGEKSKGSQTKANASFCAGFRAIGSTIKFDGFMRIYPVKITENLLPKLKINQIVTLKKLNPAQHFTEPPPRYNDASLVKELEKKGIGRPSTYAPIIETIQKRGYVNKDPQKKIHPTEIGSLVNQVLVEHFPNIVDYDFTAEMENNLDAIADKKQKWTQVITQFYQPFAQLLENKYKEVNKKKLTEETTNTLCPGCQKHNLIIKIGRFGKFLACPGFPDCKHTAPLAEDNQKLINYDKLEETACPKCLKKMILKEGKYGKFLACPGFPDCKHTQKIEQKINLKCPKCQPGEIVLKRTKKGKVFYGCNKYPECDYASWKKPTS